MNRKQLFFAALLAPALLAQDQAVPTPKEAAPYDITGNWVSVITEDWRWRMMLPEQGDYSSVPLNAEGQRVADEWDPSKLATDGCRAYGAAGIMRVPGRLRISWEGDQTLRIDTDAGLQTRYLRFNADTIRVAGPSRQGLSAAVWDQIPTPGGLGVSLQFGPGQVGSLKVVTTSMLPGYLRRNGVPYSGDAVMTEYIDKLTAYETDWLTILTIVEDPRYLNQPFITSSHFKRETDDSKWTPRPCEE